MTAGLLGDVSSYDGRTGELTVRYDFSQALHAADFIVLASGEASGLKGGAVRWKARSGAALANDRLKAGELGVAFRLTRASGPFVLVFGRRQAVGVRVDEKGVSLRQADRHAALWSAGGKELAKRGATLARSLSLSVQQRGRRFTVHVDKVKALAVEVPSLPEGDWIAWGSAGKGEASVDDLTLIGRPATWWLEEAAAAEAMTSGAAKPNAWTNQGGDGLWATGANWSLGHPPREGECAVFEKGASTCRARKGTVAPKLAGLSLHRRFRGRVLFDAGFAESGGQKLKLTGDLCLLGGRLTVTGLVRGNGTSAKGTGVTIRAANLLIGRGGLLESDKRGFLAKQGPGFVYSRGGSAGAHGGKGGGRLSGRARLYGDPKKPVTLGSGSMDANGGGAIRLIASGTVNLNGLVSASGGGRSGGGAGGSIWITCVRFEGRGRIRANGGHDEVGGGGGGRVAVYSEEQSFRGKMEAKGGTGHFPGHDGSVVTLPMR